MNIVFFGDSLTAGNFGVNYVNKLALLLPGHHFYNEGVNGDTSLNLYRRVDRDVIDRQPDGVVIMIGVNDAYSWAVSDLSPYFRFVKRIAGGRISPVAFRENVRAIIMKLLSESIKVWVVLPPVEYNPDVVSALREMNMQAKSVCEELQVPTLDLMARLTPFEISSRPAPRLLPFMAKNFVVLLSPDYDRRRDDVGHSYSFDGIHLTEAGAQLFAEAIAEFLRENGVHNR
ncbi:MAG: hypothetical protein K8L99_00335 [Anaerolineae bacterium]|nr:hypothetical protein [Anaerolineae bacterium]